MQSKVNNNRLSTRRSVILHYYNLGHRCAAEIARQTKIPVRTVRYNLAKIKKEGGVEHRCGNGRPRKITAEDSRAIGQWIRRNNEITASEIVEKLQSNRNLIVSRWTVQRQLHRLGYENVLPRGTPMLTNEQKERRGIYNGQWHIKTMIGVEQCFLTKRHINYSETQFVVGPSMLKKKKKELRRANKRSWYGVHLVSKVNCRGVPFEQLWMDPFMLKYFENIFLHVQENSLGVIGDTNKTTTPNTPVK